MNTETKKCQNCKSEFTIEQEDFEFYEKIKVPAPTWCPECRIVRRMLWRNVRSFYKRKCDAPGHTEEMISLFPKTAPYIIYDQQYWWSDNWNALDYGRPYDFSKSFFEQYADLLRKMPLITLSNTASVNSEYCSSAAWNKDCYLVSEGGWNERVSYGNRTVKVKDSLDLYIAEASELCYDDLYIKNCYHLFFSINCEECSNSVFLYNCRNCQNCFGCSNLRNGQYCFFNKQLTKEEYLSNIEQFDLGSCNTLNTLRKKFLNEIYLRSIHKYADFINCVDCTGDHLRNTKDCKHCFDFGGDTSEHCRFVNWSGFGAKDLYDTGPGAGWKCELLYEGVDINNSSSVVGGIVVYDSNNVHYSIYNHASSHIFACIGLRKKQYCILNKQYTKEEYEKLVPKIIEHMNDMPYIDKKGRVYKYGEFFPPELSPFAYNETVAQEYFPLTKEEAEKQGYLWKEPEQRDYQITIKPEDLPDHIKDVKDDILEQIIGCEHQGKCNEQCTEAFKIIKPELEFYRKMNLPLPRLCPNCRHYQRLKLRNPLKLWHRKCQCAGIYSDNKVYENTIEHLHHGKDHCPNEFETSYSPDRKEIVYCEKCYQGEVV